jgi:hypothetical protein
LKTVSSIVPLTCHFRVGIGAIPIFVGHSIHGIVIFLTEWVLRIGRNGILKCFGIAGLVISGYFFRVAGDLAIVHGVVIYDELVGADIFGVAIVQVLHGLELVLTLL